MDPYVEQHWGDIHSSLVTYARDQLQKVLPRDLRARAEERIIISGLSGQRSIFPDVRIRETKRKSQRPSASAAGIAFAEPLVIELPDESETQTFIEIREREPGSSLVTVLEVLRPSNKRSGSAQ